MTKAELKEKSDWILANLFTDTDWCVDDPRMEAFMDIVAAARLGLSLGYRYTVGEEEEYFEAVNWANFKVQRSKSDGYAASAGIRCAPDTAAWLEGQLNQKDS